MKTLTRRVLALPAGENVLRSVCDPVVDFAAASHVGVALVAVIQERSAAGMAAPQIGELLRLVAWRSSPTSEVRLMANPEIVGHSKKTTVEREVCESIPERSFFVERWREVTVTFQNVETGEPKRTVLSGFAARVFQHERDHLDGILIDRGGSLRHVPEPGPAFYAGAAA